MLASITSTAYSRRVGASGLSDKWRQAGAHAWMQRTGAQTRGESQWRAASVELQCPAVVRIDLSLDQAFSAQGNLIIAEVTVDPHLPQLFAKLPLAAPGAQHGGHHPPQRMASNPRAGENFRVTQDRSDESGRARCAGTGARAHRGFSTGKKRGSSMAHPDDTDF